jgi:hypothetical protein
MKHKEGLYAGYDRETGYYDGRTKIMQSNDAYKSNKDQNHVYWHLLTESPTKLYDEERIKIPPYLEQATREDDDDDDMDIEETCLSCGKELPNDYPHVLCTSCKKS